MSLDRMDKWPPLMPTGKRANDVDEMVFQQTKQHLLKHLNGFGDIIDISKLERGELQTVILDEATGCEDDLDKTKDCDLLDEYFEDEDDLDSDALFAELTLPLSAENFDPLVVVQFIERNIQKKIDNLLTFLGPLPLRIERDFTNRLINNLDDKKRATYADLLVARFYETTEAPTEPNTPMFIDENPFETIIEPEHASQIYDFLESREEELRKLHLQIRMGTL